MKVLAIIPARGGSKGIRHKNIIDFNGRPLLAWSIQAAIDSGVCDEVMVSTEDPNIAEIARQYGAQIPFMRSAELAQDHSKTIECVMEVLEMYAQRGRNFDVIIILQPTTPLRNAQHLKKAFQLFVEKGCRSLNSVVHAKHPVFLYTMNQEKELAPFSGEDPIFIRRQNLPEVFAVNGAIAIHNVAELTGDTNLNHSQIGFVMSAEQFLDIDDQEDLALAKFLHPYVK